MLHFLAGLQEFRFQPGPLRERPLLPQGRQGLFQFLHLPGQAVEFLGQETDSGRRIPGAQGSASRSTARGCSRLNTRGRIK